MSLRELILRTFVEGASPDLRRRWNELHLSPAALSRLLMVEDCSSDLLVRLREIELEGALPAPVRDELARRAHHETARMLAVRVQLQTVLQAMRALGIEVTLLKGAAFLAARMRPHRPCTDLDVLIHSESREQACEAMAAMGYRAVTKLRIEDHHHLPPFVKEDAVPVELHLRTLNRELPPTEPVAPSRELVPGTLVLHPTEWCWHALAHEARHHDLAGRVRGALDVAALVARYGAEIDWQVIGRRAHRWPDDIGVVALSVRALCPQVPLPVGVTSRVKAAFVTYGRERAARGAASDRAFVAALYRLGALAFGTDPWDAGDERDPPSESKMRYVPEPVAHLASLMAITLGRDVS